MFSAVNFGEVCSMFNAGSCQSLYLVNSPYVHIHISTYLEYLYPYMSAYLHTSQIQIPAHLQICTCVCIPTLTYLDMYIPAHMRVYLPTYLHIYTLHIHISRHVQHLEIPAYLHAYLHICILKV